jgi:hypothetical protein
VGGNGVEGVKWDANQLTQRRLCRREAHLATHEEPTVNAKPLSRTRPSVQHVHLGHVQVSIRPGLPKACAIPEIRYTRFTCFFFSQAGQPVQPVVLILAATELTPAHMPEQIEVTAYACVDEAMCRRVAVAQHPGGWRPKWAGWCVHREAVGRVQ